MKKGKTNKTIVICLLILLIPIILIGHELDKSIQKEVYAILESNHAELSAEEIAFVEFFVSKAPDPILIDKVHTELYKQLFGHEP